MIRVRCGVTELEEHGEVIAVGDRIEQLASPADGSGVGPTDAAWWFDRYAAMGGGPPAVISGRVVAIHAMHLQPAGSARAAIAGPVLLEAIASTADARRPAPPPITAGEGWPDGGGGRWASLHPDVQATREQLAGWVLTLEEEQVHPLER